MRDRLATIGGGLVAFALVVVLLVPVGRDESQRVSRPLAVDRGPAGLEAMRRWLERGGAETEILGRRYTALAADLHRSPVGNLLVVTLPQHTPSRTREREALRTWIAQGNSALVLVAAGNVPVWRLSAAEGTTDPFLASLGFALVGEPGKEPDPAAGPEANGGAMPPDTRADGASAMELAAGLESVPVELPPRAPDPLTRDVRTVSTWSMPDVDDGWRLTGAERGRAVLPLLTAPDGGTALWEGRVGRGRAWISRYPDLFANGALAKTDNARLLSNLVNAALGPNGRVIFDDMHQGATNLYDAKAFFGDPRLINTLAFMIGFWLLYLVGRSRRLAPAREAVSRYYAADLARAMAGFFVRRLSPATVARQMFVFFFDDIRGRYGLPTNGQPAWSILSGTSRVPADDVRELQLHYERTTTARKFDLISLARLMQRTRENLL